MSAEPAPSGIARRLGGSVQAGLAVIGLVVVLGALLLLASTLFRDRPEQARVAAADPAGKAVFSLQNAQQLEGTRLIRIDVAASDGEDEPYSSAAPDDLRNIILVDKATGASRRLLPDNQRRIVESHFLPADASSPAPAVEDPMLDGTQDAGRPAPPAYFVLALEQAADGRLQDVVVGRLGDGRRAAAMEGIGGLQSVWIESPDRLGLLVRERLGLYHRLVDLRSLRVVSSRRIEIG
jgi:hypothetical protein